MKTGSFPVQLAVLVYLTFAGLLVGVRAAFFPRSFADHVPISRGAGEWLSFRERASEAAG